MVAAVVKVLTVVIVVLLILIIIPLVGPFITEQMPEFAKWTGNILEATWEGFQKLLHGLGFSGSGRY
jgi:predicted PurR-regulated permease PerM